jgi:hypothetical protein
MLYFQYSAGTCQAYVLIWQLKDRSKDVKITEDVRYRGEIYF